MLLLLMLYDDDCGNNNDYRERKLMWESRKDI